VQVSSAGLLEGGRPATNHAQTVIAGRGLDLGRHRSRQLAAEQIARADLIIGMARRHVREVVLLDRSAENRTFTLKELVRRADGRPRRPDEPVDAWLAGLAADRQHDDLLGDSDVDDVSDPIGGPPEVYAECADELDALLARLTELVWPHRSEASSMKVAIGSDHAGFTLKQHILGVLDKLGYEVVDLGTDSDEPVDYPPICAAVGRAVAAGEADRGIVLGGSGQGEQIAANKVPGVRAALCNDLFTASLSRQHNDANVLSMGGRIVAPGLADEILELWLSTEFEGGRHERRVSQIRDIEEQR
jgi:ribose 5-phosphate isomerase B